MPDADLNDLFPGTPPHPGKAKLATEPVKMAVHILTKLL
jgi:hypothetical protein